MIVVAFLLTCIFPTFLFSQTDGQLPDQSSTVAKDHKTFRKYFVDIHFDRFLPRGDARGPFSNSWTWGFGFGTRPIKNLQIDILDAYFLGSSGGGEKRFTTIEFEDGTRAIRSIEGKTVLGGLFNGRLVFPIRDERMVFSVGGGIAGMSTNERIEQFSNESVVCLSCASASGIGPTIMAEIMTFGEGGYSGGGLHVRFAQINSDASVRGTLRSPVKDRFILIGGTLTFRLGR